MEEKKITLKISGMGCRACSEKIEKALALLPGILEVKVDHAAGRGEIRLDPEKITSSEIVEAIDDLGYEAEE